MSVACISAEPYELFVVSTDSSVSRLMTLSVKSSLEALKVSPPLYCSLMLCVPAEMSLFANVTVPFVTCCVSITLLSTMSCNVPSSTVSSDEIVHCIVTFLAMFCVTVCDMLVDSLSSSSVMFSSVMYNHVRLLSVSFIFVYPMM